MAEHGTYRGENGANLHNEDTWDKYGYGCLIGFAIASPVLLGILCELTSITYNRPVAQVFSAIYHSLLNR